MKTCDRCSCRSERYEVDEDGIVFCHNCLNDLAEG